MFSKRAINMKKKLASGGKCPGAWLRLPSPEIAEIFGGSGLDWVLFDDEHSAINQETQQRMLMGLRGSETVALVRVAWNERAPGSSLPIPRKNSCMQGWFSVASPKMRSEPLSLSLFLKI